MKLKQSLKQKKYQWISVLLVLTLACLAAYYEYRLKPFHETVNEPLPVHREVIKKWANYSNSSVGFALEYPPLWTYVTIGDTASSFYLVKFGPSPLSESARQIADSNEGISLSVKVYRNFFKSSFEMQNYLEGIKKQKGRQKVVIAGHEGYKRADLTADDGLVYTEVEFAANNNLYVLHMYQDTPDTANMVSSFNLVQ